MFWINVMIVDMNEQVFINNITSNIIKYFRKLLEDKIENIYIEKNIECNDTVYDITVVADIDWKTIGETTHTVCNKICEWQKDWTDYEINIYARSIYFGIIPSNVENILEKVK